MEYIKGKGILVGTYNEDDLANGKDKVDVQRMKEETGYNYTNTEFIKSKGKPIGIKVYVCSVEDFKL